MTVAETRAIRAEYIGELVVGLAAIAREADFCMLARILDMANLEAQGCAKAARGQEDQKVA